MVKLLREHGYHEKKVGRPEIQESILQTRGCTKRLLCNTQYSNCTAKLSEEH